MTSAELRELLRGATARPWSKSDEIEGVNVVGDGWVVAKCCCRTWDQAGNDARLIVALVNHAEAIADLVEAAEEVVRRSDEPPFWPAGDVFERLRAALARVKEGE